MDRELIVRVQAGDQRAFDALTLVDYPRLYRVAHGILRDRSHAEDATQQAYLDIWRNIRRLRDPAKFEAWSYRLLVHACYAEAKRTPKWLPDTALPPAREPTAVDAFGQSSTVMSWSTASDTYPWTTGSSSSCTTSWT